MGQIQLKPHERRKLRARLRGKTPVSEAKLARCLLLADAGKTVDEIAMLVGCGTATVKRVKARFRTAGWQAAITARKAPGRQFKLTSRENRSLIARACTTPPHGMVRWTIRALADATGYSRMMVMRTLARDGLKPWREKNVVRRDHR